MIIYGRYGVAKSFEAPIIKASSRDFAATADWTPAAGDVKVSKDAGALANITTLPAVISSSVLWTWALSATEMQAKRIAIQSVDSATKAVEDQAFYIETVPPGAITAGKAQAGTASTIQLAAAEDFGADDRPVGYIVEIHGGTGAGQSRVIVDYTQATDTADISPNWTTTPDSTSLYTIWPAPPAPTATAALPAVNAVQISGDTTTADNLQTAFQSTLAEETAVPAANAPLWTKMNYWFARLRNKQTFNKDTGAWALRNDADAGNIATRTDSNDGTTYTKAEEA